MKKSKQSKAAKQPSTKPIKAAPAKAPAKAKAAPAKAAPAKAASAPMKAKAPAAAKPTARPKATAKPSARPTAKATPAAKPAPSPPPASPAPPRLQLVLPIAGPPAMSIASLGGQGGPRRAKSTTVLGTVPPPVVPSPAEPPSRRKRSNTELGPAPQLAATSGLPGWHVSGDLTAQPTTVAEVRALRLAGRHDEHRTAASWLARRAPTDVLAQIEAAYASDRAGQEHVAIRHYDAAYKLDVPDAERRQFYVGYCSTLRNVGRSDEAVALLAQAVVDDPHYPPYAAFLALALMSVGQPRVALATMLGCALDAARPDAFERYTRALGEYQRELLEPQR